MKIIGWNINGIRGKSMNVLSNSKEFNTECHLASLLTKYDPDVICFGETKCQGIHTSMFECLPFMYKSWICSRGRKGYSGVCILSKTEFIDHGSIPTDDEDLEGRSRVVEFDDFLLIYVYTPNSGGRFEYRVKWDRQMYSYLKTLSLENKKIIFGGDLNVVHERDDIHNSKILSKGVVAGTLPHEREYLNKYLELGYIDIWRQNNPGIKKYSWWNYRTRARSRDIGWRIDYFLVRNIEVKDAMILNDVMGSDHCPIYIEV